jgi:hypothetical protein
MSRSRYEELAEAVEGRGQEGGAGGEGGEAAALSAGAHGRASELAAIVNYIFNHDKEAYMRELIARSDAWFELLVQLVGLLKNKWPVWNVLKKLVFTGVKDRVRRYQIDWKGNPVVVVCELRIVHLMLTDGDDEGSSDDSDGGWGGGGGGGGTLAAWRRGFVREQNQFVQVLDFVSSLDFSDQWLCRIAFPVVLKILDYGVEQLLLLPELPAEDATATPPPELTQLLAMGFEREACRAMLASTNNNVELSMEHLLDGTQVGLQPPPPAAVD